MLPVAGRPVAGWVGPAVTHARGDATGSARWRAPLPQLALTGGQWRDAKRLRLPPECGRVRLAEASDGPRGWPVAVLLDERATSPVLCFAVAGTDRFSLLDAEDRDRMVAGWGRALTALSQRDSGVTHLQLLERASVAEVDTGEAEAWAASRGSSEMGLPGTVGAVTVRRDSVLAVRLDRVRDGRDAAGRARDIATHLLAAELVARPLGAVEARDLLGGYSRLGRRRRSDR